MKNLVYGNSFLKIFKLEHFDVVVEKSETVEPVLVEGDSKEDDHDDFTAELKCEPSLKFMWSDGGILMKGEIAAKDEDCRDKAFEDLDFEATKGFVLAIYAQVKIKPGDMWKGKKDGK